MKPLVMGIGNVLRGDDGLGIHCIDELRATSCPAQVDLIICETSLMDYIQDMQHRPIVVLVDALDKQMPPGAVCRVAWPRCGAESSTQQVDSHGNNIQLCLNIVRQLSGSRPDLLIYGVQPQTLSGRNLSRMVERGVAYLIQRILTDMPWRQPDSRNSKAWIYLRRSRLWKEVDTKMHGFGWVKTVLEQIEKEAPSLGITDVSKLYIALGELSHYPQEELELAFDCLKDGTLCEKAVLVFEHRPAVARCTQCEKELPWSQTEGLCPSCGQTLAVVAGQDIELLGID